MTANLRKPQARNGIRADAPDAPIEGSDAGPASDLKNGYLDSQIRKYRRLAKSAFADAQRSVAHDRIRAERKIRQALDSAAKAFWWAEDTDMEERQHILLHQIGRWRRRNNLGCLLAYERNRYSQRCPAAIAHKRIGLSIGFTGIRICSICHKDISDDCPHLRDRSYWVRGGADAEGACRVCLQKACTHHANRLYRARVISIIGNKSSVDLEEVSIVRKPANPEARLTELPIDLEQLAAHLGGDFLPGVSISCDQCLGPCQGFSDFSSQDEAPN